MTGYHLAEINIARALAPLDDPRMADFTGNLERINGLAEQSDGFVWRLKDDSGDATAIRVLDDPLIIINMSVWEGVEPLKAFAYKTLHTRFFQRRTERFRPIDGPHMALWWVPRGTGPTPEDGRARLQRLAAEGPGPEAFTFAKVFEASDAISG